MDASRLYTIIRLFFRVVTLLGTVTIRNPGAIPVSLPPPIPLLVGWILILDMNSAGVTRTFRRRLDTSTNMYMLFSSDTDTRSTTLITSIYSNVYIGTMRILICVVPYQLSKYSCYRYPILILQYVSMHTNTIRMSIRVYMYTLLYM